MEDLTLTGPQFAFLATKSFACGFMVGISLYFLSAARKSVRGIFTSSFTG